MRRSGSQTAVMLDYKAGASACGALDKITQQSPSHRSHRVLAENSRKRRRLESGTSPDTPAERLSDNCRERQQNAELGELLQMLLTAHARPWAATVTAIPSCETPDKVSKIRRQRTSVHILPIREASLTPQSLGIFFSQSNLHSPSLTWNPKNDGFQKESFIPGCQLQVNHVKTLGGNIIQALGGSLSENQP